MNQAKGRQSPVFPVALGVDEPRNHDARRRTDMALVVVAVPDVAGTGRAIVGAAEPVRVSETVQVSATERRPHRDVSEDLMEWLEQVPAQAPARFKREFRIVGHIGNAVDCGNFGIEEVAHEEVFRQPFPAEAFECPHGSPVWAWAGPLHAAGRQGVSGLRRMIALAFLRAAGKEGSVRVPCIVATSGHRCAPRPRPDGRQVCGRCLHHITSDQSGPANEVSVAEANWVADRYSWTHMVL